MIALVQEELLKYGIKRTKRIVILRPFDDSFDILYWAFGSGWQWFKIPWKFRRTYQKDYPEAYQIGEDIMKLFVSIWWRTSSKWKGIFGNSYSKIIVKEKTCSITRRFYFWRCDCCLSSRRSYKKKVGKDQSLGMNFRKQGRFLADPASDFYHQYSKDIELWEVWRQWLACLLLGAVFFQRTWQGQQEGVEFYHRVFAECAKHHVLPFVTPHHFDTRKFCLIKVIFLIEIQLTGSVCGICRILFQEFQRFIIGALLTKFILLRPINTLLGVFPPGIQYDLSKVIQCLTIWCMRMRVVNLFKEKGYLGEMVVHSLETKYPATDSEEDKHAAFLDDALSFVLARCHLSGYYSEETMEALHEICAATKVSYEFLEATLKNEKLVTEMIILNQPLSMSFC